ECQSQFQKVRDDVEKAFDEEKINMSRYAEANSFLTALNKEVARLGDPSAAKMLAGMRPRGGDVLELVGFMTSNGLQFAPCRPGEGRPHRALFPARAGFAERARAAPGGGNRPTMDAPPPPTAKGPAKKAAF